MASRKESNPSRAFRSKEREEGERDMLEELYYEYAGCELDYEDAYDKDIRFIDALIEAIGYQDAKSVLRELKED